MERSWLHLALFLALAVLLQGLRLFLPMIPGPVQMFFIGSLLNAVMAAAVWETRTRWALVIGAALPVGAFLQGQLPLLPLVPVVALGNMAFQLAVSCLPGRVVLAAPVLKAALLYAGTQLVLRLLAVPAPLAVVLGFMMSWPQLVTGVLGLSLARLLARRFGWQTGR